MANNKKKKTSTTKDEVIQRKLARRKTRCAICNHQERELIEMRMTIATLANKRLPMTELTKLINKEHKEDFSVETITNHYKRHKFAPTATESGVVLANMKGEDGAKGYLSPMDTLEALCIQASLDVATGAIRCRNVGEMLAVFDMMQRFDEKRRDSDVLEEGTLQGIHQTMKVLADAMRATVSMAEIEEITRKARALGTNLDFDNLTTNEPIPVSAVQDQVTRAKLAEDYKELGRSKTRPELMQDGELSPEILNEMLD